MAFPGCEVVGIDSIEDNPSAGDKTVTITANIAGSTDTKVSLTPGTDNNGNPIIKVDWKPSGEKFYVLGKDGEAKEFIQVSGNVFEGVMPEPYDDGACVAVYNPEADDDYYYYHNQTGTLDEKYVCMLAIFDAQFESITFEHMTYIMKTAFKYNGNPLQNITSVKIDAFDGTGDFELSLTPAEGKDCFDYLNCPDCGKKIHVFGKSRLDEIAAQFDLPVLARLPIDPSVAEAFDNGQLETVLTDGVDAVISAIENQ